MTKPRLTLDIIDVASPCSADWNSMQGDERKRYCADCKLNVYNISDMTRSEAEELINSHEGRLCGRFYRRKDGTIITRDCPVGLRLVRRRLARSVAAIAALLGFVTFGTVQARGSSNYHSWNGPLSRLVSWIEGDYWAVAGDISGSINFSPTAWTPPSPPVVTPPPTTGATQP